MNRKIIAVAAVVVILVVASIGYVLIAHGNDDSEFHPEALLEVYGNANGDERIDNEDISIINDIIAGNKQLADYPYADANYDGIVNEDDVAQVQKIINREETTVYHINHYDGGTYVASTKFPIVSALCTGAANQLIFYKLLGVEDKIKGISYSASSPPDEVLFPYFSKMSSLGSNAMKMDLDAASNIITSENCTALITADNRSYITNESDFENVAGVDVVRVPAASVVASEWASTALLLGFLLDAEDRSYELTNWFLSFVNEIESKVSSIENLPLSLTSSSNNAVASSSSDYTKLAETAGSKYALEGMDSGGSAVISFNKETDTWLYNYKIDYIIVFKTMGYGTDVDVSSEWNRALNFSQTEAYKNGNCVLISGDMPVPVRLAYCAEIMHPDIFGEGYGDKIHQEFVDKFFGDDYDVSQGTFMITLDDL